jgi:hypothetical protein
MELPFGRTFRMRGADRDRSRARDDDIGAPSDFGGSRRPTRRASGADATPQNWLATTWLGPCSYPASDMMPTAWNPMTLVDRPLRFLAVVAILAAGVGTPCGAEAEGVSANPREAAKHFERGVALYGETDYRAALVEFKRAYALAPNTAVLYNIGEAQFQLQDYAGALGTFTRYIEESAPGDPHRGDVETNLEVLHSRVGHLSVTTVPPGADITLDDQPVGKTPFEDRLLVSVGHRKVTASMVGHATLTRYVDVAADDNMSVTLDLGAAGAGASNPTSAQSSALRATDGSPPGNGGETLRIVGWVATGVLAAGAGVSGGLALKESSDLRASRSTYPVSSATLKRDSNLTWTYSVLADSLAIAAALVGGVTLVSTVSTLTHKRSSVREARVWLGPSSANFEMKF